MSIRRLVAGSFALLALPMLTAVRESARRTEAPPPAVTVLRVPEHGIQPQVVVGPDGAVDLIELTGDPAAADIEYSRKPPGVGAFSRPIRVNSQQGSAIAIGSVRGPQIALGRNGRVHVAWMGSHPEGPKRVIPMFYTRLNRAGTAFEPQRNVMTFATGLDGGASVAADGLGDVYVVWHANPENNGEAHRRVWLARSTDGGRTFVREVSIDPPLDGEPAGACGCCGMRAFADRSGSVYVLYRAATAGIHRDMILLVSRDRGQHFTAERVAKWNLNACPMTTDFISRTLSGLLLGWETAGQVFYADVKPGSGKIDETVAAPGPAHDRKHPVVVANSRGDTLLAWTEGTAWARGGSVAWQVFDPAGNPLGPEGSAPGLPAWDLVAAFAGNDGNFTILY